MNQREKYMETCRLMGWDYKSTGSYFITMCTKDRVCYFGEVIGGIMGLSVPGCVAWHYWREIPNHFSQVELDAFIVMPNHIHAIICIKSNLSELGPAGSVSMITKHYKEAITRWCRSHGHDKFAWQSRFYDHVIRDEKSLDRIRKYIYSNPENWYEEHQNLF